MSKRSNKYMLMGKVSYMISAALMIAALVTNLIPPRIASAHHSTITGSVACQSDGTKLVTWTITNWQLTGDPFTITAISPSITGVGVGTVVGASVQGTQSFAGNDHSTVSLSVTGQWSDSSNTNSGSVSLGSNTCSVVTPPPPASASVTVGACTFHDGQSSTAVTITLSHATLSINSHTYNSSTSIDLPPGTYHYTWNHKSGYSGSGSGDVTVGECRPPATASLSIGTCSYRDGVSTVHVNITLSHAELNINGNNYDSSRTIHLNPGSYPWTASADNNYVLGGDASGTLVVEGCAPPPPTITICYNGVTYPNVPVANLGQYPGYTEGACPPPPPVTICWNGVTYPNVAVADLGNYPGYTQGACPDTQDASASVTAGACSWTVGAGSMTPVSINLNGATLLINGGTYSASTTINLGPGNYPYSWTAQPGYKGSGSGSVDIGDCTPPDATALGATGPCSWSQAAGSMTPVIFTLNGASLTYTKDGTSESWGPFTQSGSINLGPGNYSYVWTALPGYKGGSSGTFSIGECIPPDASASVSAGSCSWTIENGSLTPVTLTLNGASLLINGVTYYSSTTIDLGPGSYPYSWSAQDGFKGSGNGSVDIGNCTPPDASASVVPGDCSWTREDGSLTPVTITINGASLFINGGTYTATTTIDLEPGNYPFSWVAQSGYKGSGEGSILIGDCTPGNAEASVSTGTCSYTKESGAITPVTITLTGASFTVDGNTYNASTIIDLAAGIYPYTWTHLTGYIGEGSGDLNVGNCNPEDPLVKTANPLTYSAVGELISYTYSVTNLGNVPLTGVLVTDDKATVSCPQTTLAVNESMTCTASYTITQADLDAGSVTNHATSVTDQTGPIYAQATVTAIVRTGLSIDKSVAEKIYTFVGDLLHYSYLVTNTGNVSLTGVGVTDDKTTVNCPKDILAPAESMTCTATYSVKYADMQSVNIVNTAFAFGQYGSVVVNSTPDSATVIRFLKLILSSMCAANPGAKNGWLVANNNPYEVDFEYAIDGGVSGVGTVPGNSTVSFDTPVGSGTGVMSLYKSGELQNSATPRTGCNENPPPPVPGCMDPTALNYNAAATQNDGSCLYGAVTGGGPAVLIPVTGVDMGLLGRTLPGSLFGLSFSFVGLGLVLTGLSRRRDD